MFGRDGAEVAEPGSAFVSDVEVMSDIIAVATDNSYGGRFADGRSSLTQLCPGFSRCTWQARHAQPALNRGSSCVVSTIDRVTMQAARQLATPPHAIDCRRTSA